MPDVSRIHSAPRFQAAPYAHRSHTRTTFWLAFALPFLIALSAHWRFYFVVPTAEHGDFAANAIQIWGAMHFRDILGNYSRFHFHHPGPAFFYVYGLGELLFYHLLAIVPSPNAAHSLAGLILQSWFFAAGISTLARYFPKHCMLPIITACCCHFFLTEYAFTSIWPPHQLLMPFFCALLSGSALMIGDFDALLLFVLSSCFCVHGHVAQPLFVGPLALLAGIGAVIHLARLQPSDSPFHRLKGAVRTFIKDWRTQVGAAIIGLFLLPMFLDLLRGRNSNFAAILAHLQNTPVTSNSFGNTLVYYLDFLHYWGSSNLPHGAVLENLMAHSASVLIWAAIAIFPVGWLLSRNRNKSASCANGGKLSTASFVIAAMISVAALVPPLIAWGIRMEGGMYVFNTFFFYAILAVILAIATGLVFLNLRPSRFVTAAFVVPFVTMITVKAWHEPMAQNIDITVPHLQGVLTKLSIDKRHLSFRQKLFVYLIFPDPRLWPDAAMIASDLSQHGIAWRIPPQWAFLFGREHALSKEDATKLSGAVWLKLMPGKPIPSSGFIRLRSGVYVTALPRAEVDVNPARFPLDYSIGSKLFSSAAGMAPVDKGANFRWSVGPETIVAFQIHPTSRDVAITLDFTPFTLAPKLKRQRFTVEFSGVVIGHYSLSRRGNLQIVIPSLVWNAAYARTGTAELAFSWENATSPASLGINSDVRKLAISFRSISFGFLPSLAVKNTEHPRID